MNDGKKGKSAIGRIIALVAIVIALHRHGRQSRCRSHRRW
jgi:hypothetical protein